MALHLATPLLASLPKPNPGCPCPSRGGSLALSHPLHSLSSGPGTQGCRTLRFRPRAEGDQESRRTSGGSGEPEKGSLRGDAAGSRAQSQEGDLKDARSYLPTEASSAGSHSSESGASEAEPPITSSSNTQSEEGQSPGRTQQGSEGASPEPSSAYKEILDELKAQFPDEEVKAEEFEEQLNVILESLASPSLGRRTVYTAMAALARVKADIPWPLRDENGVPLGETMTNEQLARALEKVADNPEVDAATAQAVRKTLLGPENASCPFVVRSSGEVGEYLECEVEAGTLFFGELREGCEPKAALEWVSSALQKSYPQLRVALIPIPETAEDIAEQYKLDPSRRCALLLFKQFSALQLPVLRWFLLPSFLLALLQLKDVTIQDASLNSGFDSSLATGLFIVAAILPTTSAFCGQLVWSIAYNRPPPLDFVPVLSPGSGISALFSNVHSFLSSRKEAVDFALASSLASLAASLVLLRSSSCSTLQSLPLPLPSLDEFGLPASVAEGVPLQIPGTVLVPQSILAHAVPLNQMADRLACASLPDPNNSFTVLLALPPLALAGLLGLHLTALGLIPWAKSNGARLVEGTVDDEGLVVLSQLLALIFLAVCFFTTGSPVFPIFFFSATVASLLSIGEQLVPLRWDSVTPAGALRSGLSAVLVGGGLLLLLPKPLYGWLLDAGLGPFAESFYSLFLPTR